MKYTTTLCGLLLIFLPAGCTDTTSDPPHTADTPLQVIAEIQGSKSRAVSLSNYDKRSFDTNDVIYVKGSTSGATYPYAKKSGSLWGYGGSSSPLSMVSGDTYTGYYPAAVNTILENQTTPNDFHSSNQLKTPAVTPANNTVRFTETNAFAPVNAKITMMVRYQSSSTPISATIEVYQENSSTAYKTYQCLYTTAETKTAATLQNWACIIPAASGYYLRFTFKRNEVGKEITGTFTDSKREFKSGYNYTYNFQNSDELVLTGVTVTSFQEAGEEESGSAT